MLNSLTYTGTDVSTFSFKGRHVFGELYGISFQILNDEDYLLRVLKTAVTSCGATVCSAQSKKFDPHGVTVLLLLAESHASFHTYPDKQALFFDIFTCGKVDPLQALHLIQSVLRPTHVSSHILKRGDYDSHVS